MEGRGHRERWQRAGRQHRCDPVVLVASFEHRPRQLLDKQRHAVGALDDLLNDVAAQRRVSGKTAGFGLAFAYDSISGMTETELLNTAVVAQGNVEEDTSSTPTIQIIALAGGAAKPSEAPRSALGQRLQSIASPAVYSRWSILLA